MCFEKYIYQSLLIGIVLLFPFQAASQTMSADKSLKIIHLPSGEQYATKLMIDGKRWLLNNLNIEIAGAYCYENSPANCQKFGRLYTWEAAVEACQQLGEGWRLPNHQEWEDFSYFYGGVKSWVDGLLNHYGNPGKAYRNLINGGTTDFNALLGGYRTASGQFFEMGTFGDYWTSTESSIENAHLYYFNAPNRAVYHDELNKKCALSVRCIFESSKQ